MAINDLTLQLIIKAVDLATKDIDGVHDKLEDLKTVLLGNEFDRSAEGMRSFGEAVKDSTAPLAAAAKNTLALSAAITGVAGYMAGNAYQAAKDYESALADLAKVLDGGKEEAKAYGEQLNELALKYGQNGQELVAAMANFVQAGYSVKDAYDLVEQSIKLKIAGDIEAAQSSEYLVSILKGFKAPASEAASTVDLLNEVSNKYATDVKELAIGMAGISPIAKQMGFSMSETAGLLTPVIEVYRSGSEAADALKTGLQKLIDDSAPVKGALASIGVSQFDLNGKLRAGKDIFLDVAKAMVGLDSATKQYVIGQLVGVDQAGRMGQVFDNLAGYLGVTETALNSTGSALKEVSARLDTAEAKSKRAEESFRQLSVTLGNTFKDEISSVIAATGDLAASFDRAVKSGDLAPLLNAIKPQITAVENLFRAMATNLEAALERVDWTPLVEGIKAFSSEFGQAFGALTDGMDLTTVEGLRNLLQALINLMGNFTQYVAGVVDGLEPFLDSLNMVFGAISTNLPTFSNLAGQITGLATSANQVIPVIASLGGGIFGAVGFVVELTLKIGLLVGALKLLSAAGIPVGAMLGGLVSRFLALNPAVAGALAALAGLPGLVAGLAAAAGGIGYAIGTVINKTVEWASGGQSIGTMLYDLIHGSDEAEKAITRTATAEELAAAAAKRHARELEAKAEAERRAREEAEKSTPAYKETIAKAAEETAAIERLKAKYVELGLVWSPYVEERARANRQAAEQKVATLELATALDKVGVDAGVMSGRMTAAGDEMLKALNGIAANSQSTSKEVNAAILAMIPKLETQAELDALRKKIEALGEDGKLTGEQVSVAFGMIADRIKNLSNDSAFAFLIRQLAEIREETERDIDASDRSARIKEVQIEAAIRLAKAKGDEAAAARLTAQATQEEVERARERTEQLGLQITQIDAHIQKLYAQANADGQYTDAEREAIEALKEKSAELAVNRAQIEAHLPLMEREAQQAAILAGPVGQLSRLYAEQTQEHQRAADASDRYYDTQVKEIDGAIRVAQARGDEAKAAQLQAEQQKILIEQAQALAQAKAVEAADAAKALDAKTLELAADGELSKADREQIASLQEIVAQKATAAEQARNHADAMQEEARAAKGVVEGMDLFTNATARNAQITRQQAEAQKEAVANAKMAGGIISKFYNNAIESLSSLSDNAVSAFKTMRGEIPPTTNSLDDMRKATEKIDAAIANVPGHAGAFVAFLTKITADANTVKKAWIDQADLAERLGENLQEAGQHGEVALAGMIRQAEGSLRSLNLLDQSRLDNLKQEIEDANERLREMQQETEDARQRLAQMNAELMETKGEDEKAKVLRQQIDYQETLADIEMQRQKAQLEGNRDLLAILDQQKSKLEEINTAKLAGIRAEAEEKKKAASTPPPSSNTGGSGSTSRSSGITQRYALDLSFGGKTLNATSEQDPADFLRALEHARLRT